MKTENREKKALHPVEVLHIILMPTIILMKVTGAISVIPNGVAFGIGILGLCALAVHGIVWLANRPKKAKTHKEGLI